MSTFKVEVCKISEVTKHPNADKLDLIKLDGKDWQCVTSKDSFKSGDLVVYFPIDSLLPAELETKIFGLDSKIKLHNSRVKTIKLRGAVSQGLVVPPQVVNVTKPKEGLDVTTVLNVTKYEVPVSLSNSGGQQASRKQTNPHFRKYTGIENAKNYSKVFSEGDEVVVTEKIHGSNFRAGYVPFYANTLFKKLKQFLGFAPKYEFVFGSHNVQLQNKLLYKGAYSSEIGNVYVEAVRKYNLKEVLKPGEVIFGEVYGDGIQKSYTYGCKKGERKLVCFEVKINDEWVDPVAAKKFFDERQLPFVPVLYTGPFNKEKVLTLRDGTSVLNSEQKVREGIVVRSMKEEKSYIGRKILKFISDEYLLKNQDSETLPH